MARARRRWRNSRWLLLAVVAPALLAAWVFVPHPWEGPVVFTLTPTHGAHLADLIGVAMVLALEGIAWRRIE